MCRLQNRDTMRSASALARRDLDARLAPLDRYGLGGLSSALVLGLIALLGASMSALFPHRLRGELRGLLRNGGFRSPCALDQRHRGQRIAHLEAADHIKEDVARRRLRLRRKRLEVRRRPAVAQASARFAQRSSAFAG